MGNNSDFAFLGVNRIDMLTPVMPKFQQLRDVPESESVNCCVLISNPSQISASGAGSRRPRATYNALSV